MLLAGCGGFVGTALRYLVGRLVPHITHSHFPWATLAVNLVGCFAFGVIFALFGKFSSSGSAWCLLLTTGVCGGFTTFSTFANESVQMLQNGNLGGFVGYVATSLVAGLALVALGYWIIK